MMNTPAPAVPIQRIFQITVPPTDSTSADDGQVGPVCAMGCFQRCQYPLLQPGFCSYAGPTEKTSRLVKRVLLAELLRSFQVSWQLGFSLTLAYCMTSVGLAVNLEHQRRHVETFQLGSNGSQWRSVKKGALAQMQRIIRDPRWQHGLRSWLWILVPDLSWQNQDESQFWARKNVDIRQCIHINIYIYIYKNHIIYLTVRIPYIIHAFIDYTDDNNHSRDQWYQWCQIQVTNIGDIFYIGNL